VAIYQLDGVVQELGEYYLSENRDEQVDDVLGVFEEDMLAWMQGEDDEDRPDGEAESESAWEPMGEELLSVLDEI
jgi:hypothetical protein